MINDINDNKYDILAVILLITKYFSSYVRTSGHFIENVSKPFSKREKSQANRKLTLSIYRVCDRPIKYFTASGICN